MHLFYSSWKSLAIGTYKPGEPLPESAAYKQSVRHLCFIQEEVDQRACAGFYYRANPMKGVSDHVVET